MDIKEQKKELRSHMLRLRNELDSDFKAQYDSAVCEHLLQNITTQNYRSVHAYIPMANEIDITPLLLELLELKITVVCPKTLPKRQLENRVLRSFDDLETGIMGTKHPAAAEIYKGSYDLILVPGLAFDKNHYRLGYGGGYYDGFLRAQDNANTIGLFYPFQKVAETPRESHDIQLKQVLIIE